MAYDVRQAVGKQRGGGLGLGLGLRPKQQAGLRSAVNTGTLNEYLTGGGGRPKLAARLQGVAAQGPGTMQGARAGLYGQVNAMNKTAAAPVAAPAPAPPPPVNPLYQLAQSKLAGLSGGGDESAIIGNPQMPQTGGLPNTLGGDESAVIGNPQMPQPGGPPATLPAMQTPGLQPMPMPGRGAGFHRGMGRGMNPRTQMLMQRGLRRF